MHRVKQHATETAEWQPFTEDASLQHHDVE